MESVAGVETVPFDNLLVQRVAIQRGTVTRSTMGEEQVAWATILTSVPVLVRPTRAPADTALGLTEEVTHVIFSRPIAQIAEEPNAKWRFVLGAVNYVMIEPRDPAARGHHWETRVRRV